MKYSFECPEIITCGDCPLCGNDMCEESRCGLNGMANIDYLLSFTLPDWCELKKAEEQT